MNENQNASLPTDAIAIVGMSGRFPNAPSVAELWENLRTGAECIAAYNDEALRTAGVPDEMLSDPSYVKAGVSIENCVGFDAQFFGFNPREAEITDPQQRVFLECCYEALEAAGCAPDAFQGPIGVFASATVSTYWHNNLAGGNNRQAVGDLQALIGNDKDFLPTRVSYKLNLKGPSVNVQAACSSSLVAMHLACQSLLEGACDAALAGGVSIRFPAGTGYLFQPEGILSPDGRCRAFDADAAGTVPGQGCGVVVLKRLEDAIEDGDEIDAVILGSAMNNDGALKVGYTAPSVEGQSQVIVAAHTIAGVQADTVTCIETHGTGTRLGDPIEIKALTRAFRTTTDKIGFCAIGSLKSNVGHMDAAAGVSGLIKAVLQLKHRQIAPSLHFSRPNPELEIESSPFFVNTELREWRAEGPLRAGVSAFGLGGTNVHVVLEEAPPTPPADQARRWQVLPLSAASEAATEGMARNLHSHLRERPELSLADVAYTLQTGRKALPQRTFAVCRDAAEAMAQLSDPAGLVAGRRMDGEPSLVFLLPGQGGQYPGMGRAPYETERQFREDLDHCAELAQPKVGVDLRDILFPHDAGSPEAAERLARAEYAQPCQFALQYALGRLWIRWGVRPKALIGHSSGEYATAVLAGAMTLEGALKLVIERGRLMQSLAPSAMTSVSLPEAELRAIAEDRLSLASVNGPRQCVVSGTFEEMDRFEAMLEERGVEWRRLRISHASHSALMDPILDEFQALADLVPMRAPDIPFISNVTGTWFARADAADRTYWTRHLRHTARFSDGLKSLLGEPGRLFLEIGPGGSISGMVQQHADLAVDAEVIPSMPHAKDERDGMSVLLEGLGRLWTRGIEIDWDAFQGAKRRKVRLPTYPFERQTYFIAPDRAAASTSVRRRPGKAEMKDWFFAPAWKESVTPRASVEIAPGSKWLLFVDDTGLGGDLAARLHGYGALTWLVRARDSFAKLGEREYAIDPSNGQDYERLLHAIDDGGGSPEAIVHLWLAGDPAAAAERCQDLGYFSIHRLAQALCAYPLNGTRRLEIVSRGMHRIAGDSRVRPEMATALGLNRVLPQELPQLRCRSIDLPVDAPDSTSHSRRLFEEIARDSADEVVALRYGQRWVPTIEKTAFADETAGTSPIREGGTYIVTGGLGGIGLALAEELGERYRARLVLVSRSEFPANSDWDRWLEDHDGADETKQRIRRLRALERRGAVIAVRRADVTDEESMAGVFRETIEQFGAIHGVVHAAGLPGGGLVAVRDAAEAKRTLAPKVEGTLVLDRLLRDTDADFLMLCSSLVAVIGGAGQADYCAANCFLDAFALSRRGMAGPHVVSVNWNAWKDTGMAVHVDMPQDLRAWQADVHKMGVTQAEGREVFQRILASGLSQVAVSTENLVQQIEQRFTLTPLQVADSKGSKASTLHARPKLNVDYLAPRNSTEREIAEIWQDLLGIREIGVDDNFFSLGGHSLLGAKLVARIDTAFAVRVPLRGVFETPTVASLSAWIESRMAEAEEEKRRRLAEMIDSLDENAIEAELAKRLGGQ